MRKCGKPLNECECEEEDEDKKDKYVLEEEIPEYMELSQNYSMQEEYDAKATYAAESLGS